MAQSHFFGNPCDEDSVTHLEMCPSLKWNRGKLRCTRLLPFTYSSFHWSYCYHSFGNYCHRSSVCRKENIFFGHIIQYLAYQVCSIPKVNAVIVFYTVIITAWKVSKYGVISGPYFPVFGLNTGKCGPEITPYLDTFHAVNVV